MPAWRAAATASRSSIAPDERGRVLATTRRQAARQRTPAAVAAGGLVRHRHPADAPPPPNAKGGRFAYKTGTSYGYRDAWAVGYDGQYIIAVWVGRPDNSSVPGLLGRTAAAPILFDAFQRISERRAPLQGQPPNAIRVYERRFAGSVEALARPRR